MRRRARRRGQFCNKRVLGFYQVSVSCGPLARRRATAQYAQVDTWLALACSTVVLGFPAYEWSPSPLRIFTLYTYLFVFIFWMEKNIVHPTSSFLEKQCHLQGLRLSAFQGTSYNLWHHIFKRKKSQIIRFYIVNYLHLHTNYYYVNFKSYTANT